MGTNTTEIQRYRILNNKFQKHMHRVSTKKVPASRSRKAKSLTQRSYTGFHGGALKSEHLFHRSRKRSILERFKANDRKRRPRENGGYVR